MAAHQNIYYFTASLPSNCVKGRICPHGGGPTTTTWRRRFAAVLADATLIATFSYSIVNTTCFRQRLSTCVRTDWTFSIIIQISVPLHIGPKKAPCFALSGSLFRPNQYLSNRLPTSVDRDGIHKIPSVGFCSRCPNAGRPTSAAADRPVTIINLIERLCSAVTPTDRPKVVSVRRVDLLTD